MWPGVFPFGPIEGVSFLINAYCCLDSAGGPLLLPTRPEPRGHCAAPDLCDRSDCGSLLCEHDGPREFDLQSGQVCKGRGDAPADAAAQGDGAQKGSPRHACEHEQPRNIASQSGQVRRG